MDAAALCMTASSGCSLLPHPCLAFFVRVVFIKVDKKWKEKKGGGWEIKSPEKTKILGKEKKKKKRKTVKNHHSHSGHSTREERKVYVPVTVRSV